jgi:glycosyltransferase involved in cell wall biosynthesis
MSDYLAIPKEKIAVVPLGINLEGYAKRAAGETAPEFRVGYFARVAPEKGLHLLADAYVRLRRKTAGSAARLEAAGYTAPEHQSYLNTVRRKLQDAGLAGEFSYRGVIDREGKLAFLRSLDVLSVPATYDEPKGLFLLEAMANGVPVVQPRRGAFTEIVEGTGGGLLVESDSAEALAEGLHTLWKDRSLAGSLGRSAFDKVRERYSVTYSAARLLEVYESVLRSNEVAGSLKS